MERRPRTNVEGEPVAWTSGEEMNRLNAAFVSGLFELSPSGGPSRFLRGFNVPLYAAPPAPADKVEIERLQKAATNVLLLATDFYKKRNGHLASFEDESGEKCWIVPFDAFEDLREALKGAEA